MNLTLTLDQDALCALRDVGYAASTDKHRTPLTTVCIEVGKTALWAVATDAYMLVVRKVADLPNDVDRSGPSRLNVPADALTKAVRDALKVPKRAVCIGREVAIDDDGITVGTQTGSVNVRAHVLDDRKYPEWANTLVLHWIEKREKATDKSNHVAFNPSFVDRLGRALSCTPENGLAMRIEISGHLDPIIAGKIGDEHSFGMLMPVRDEPARTYKVSVAGVAA